MEGVIKISATLLKKSNSQLIKIATKHFNKFIRLRDSQDGFFRCISCQRFKNTEQMNAGHFYPTTKSKTRFNELNVHGQCIHCNMYLHGNLADYQKHLTEKIGKERIDALSISSRQSHRWDKLELIALIEFYKKRVKEMQ